MNFVGSLDTNALLRLITKDLPHQRRLVVELLNSTTRQFAVSDLAFSEAVFALSRHYTFSREDIRARLLSFMGLRNINCNRVMLVKALDHFVKHPALSFEDCCLAVYAELNEAEPLYTFDKKLANQLPSTKLLVS